MAVVGGERDDGLERSALQRGLIRVSQQVDRRALDTDDVAADLVRDAVPIHVAQRRRAHALVGQELLDLTRFPTQVSADGREITCLLVVEGVADGVAGRGIGSTVLGHVGWVVTPWLG